MKETIYTIPINEAFDKGGICPFCAMYDDLEKEAVRYTLGPAMMEPDFRIITNEKGFCQKHMKDLCSESKALALSLVLETHLSSVSDIFSIDYAEKGGLFKKGNSGKENFTKALEKVSDSCAICTKIENTFSHYVRSFFYMLKNEKGFLEKVLLSDGFCLEHFSHLAKCANEFLSASEYQKLFAPIIELQKKTLSSYLTYVKNFSLSFDYRNVGKKMDFPKDILQKTGMFLNGTFVPKDKNLEDV